MELYVLTTARSPSLVRLELDSWLSRLSCAVSALIDARACISDRGNLVPQNNHDHQNRAQYHPLLLQVRLCHLDGSPVVLTPPEQSREPEQRMNQLVRQDSTSSLSSTESSSSTGLRRYNSYGVGAPCTHKSTHARLMEDLRLALGNCSMVRRAFLCPAAPSCNSVDASGLPPLPLASASLAGLVDQVTAHNSAVAVAINAASASSSLHLLSAPQPLALQQYFCADCTVVGRRLQRKEEVLSRFPAAAASDSAPAPAWAPASDVHVVADLRACSASGLHGHAQSGGFWWALQSFCEGGDRALATHKPQGRGPSAGAGFSASSAFTTAMDPVRCHLLCSAAVRPGDVVLDPFSGSGAVLRMARLHGAAVLLAADEEAECARGGQTVAGSSGGGVRAQVVGAVSPWRRASVDAIVGDPPYGLRTSALHLADGAATDVPPGEKEPAEDHGVLRALLALAAEVLVSNGRLAFWYAVRSAANERATDVLARSRTAEADAAALVRSLAGAHPAASFKVVACAADDHGLGHGQAKGKSDGGSWTRVLCVLHRMAALTDSPSEGQGQDTDNKPTGVSSSLRALFTDSPGSRADPARVGLGQVDQMARRAAWTGNVAQLLQLAESSPQSLVSTDKAGASPLHFAAGYNQGAVMSMLLRQSSVLQHVDLQTAAGATPLARAARFGHTAVCAQLVAAGADWLRSDGDGQSPLGLAVAFNHCPVVKIALQAFPADFVKTHVEASGLSLLHVAAQWGSADVMVLLLAAFAASAESESNADAGELNLPVAADGTTALHVACRYGHEQAVRLLLDASRGAGGSCKDSNGRSAADIATLWGRTGVLRLLQDAATAAVAEAVAHRGAGPDTNRAAMEKEETADKQTHGLDEKEKDVQPQQKKARSAE
jgi:ankyrin repeat protein